MFTRDGVRAPKSMRIGLLAAGVVGTVIGAMAWVLVQRERRIDQEDLERRAHALVHQFAPAVRGVLSMSDGELAAALGERLDGHRRVLGFAVFRPDGRMVAAGQGVSDYALEMRGPVQRVLSGEPEATQASRGAESAVHVTAYAVTDSDGTLRGVLTCIHDMSYIEQRASSRLVFAGFWVLLITLLLVTLVVLATWVSYERPLQNLAEWMRRVRVDGAPEAPPFGLPVALLATESERLAASFRAARSVSWKDSREAVREDKTWTRDRLRAHAIDCLRDRQLVIVSNREPYMHQLQDGEPRAIVPAGGLVTALDPVLQACGGLWIAHGAGDADRITADARGRLTVPPHDARYTLRRIWLSRSQEQGYYYGLSNEGIWPLCHLAHERPIFRSSDWDQYVAANQRFADAVLDEVGAGGALIWVQDYHLALVPEMLKRVRPDLRVGIFWHIPWPNPEAFRICPWRTEILKGMLGADVVGFHLQQYCNNFLDTVDRMVEARLDWDQFAAELQGHRALVRPFPISIERWEDRDASSESELAAEIAELREQHSLGDCRVVIGVERTDYTKGIPERLRAISRFLEKYPQHREQCVFVLLAAPSRTHIRRYRELVAEIESLADEINWKFQTDNWKPLRMLIAHHDAGVIHAFMRMSPVCIVSPLHDGMNLVAKEYVASRSDGDGVLILSEFAGAARELPEALLVNPYDTERFADTINHAMAMEADERRARMSRMRRKVEENNVHRWAASFLSCLAETHVPRPTAVVEQAV